MPFLYALRRSTTSFQLSCRIMPYLSCSYALDDNITRVAFTSSMSMGFNALVLSSAMSRENNIASPCYKYVYQHCMLYCIVFFLLRNKKHHLWLWAHNNSKKNSIFFYLLCARVNSLCDILSLPHSFLFDLLEDKINWAFSFLRFRLEYRKCK